MMLLLVMELLRMLELLQCLAVAVPNLGAAMVTAHMALLLLSVAAAEVEE